MRVAAVIVRSLYSGSGRSLDSVLRMLFYILNVGNAIQVLTRIGFWVISPILAWVAVVTSLNLLFGLN